ncbi:MAG: hypothetical protein C4320_09670 [Armatimonadota bacterium]
MLAGPADLIQRARRLRKRLGGGMRQIGFLCAAGIHALEVNALRLHEDHERAQRLAEGIRGVDGIQARPPQTNLVLLEVVIPATKWVTRLESHGVRCLPVAANRLVTHHDVDDAGIARAITAIHTVARELECTSPLASAESRA